MNADLFSLPECGGLKSSYKRLMPQKKKKELSSQDANQLFFLDNAETSCQRFQGVVKHKCEFMEEIFGNLFFDSVYVKLDVVRRFKALQAFEMRFQ